ncbi:hypothetical protein [Allopontixanthobacter sediminis]|uniref:Uncharacterized protein n=1 Tax=Allopontixanthobacter sediminis TaxID=1689985 RepID=A0A845B5B4_9SPHN|nr:hypothetical protein [Allopontixanthobacter sediminis]MXP42839.1 hypothetical protein [Allopontixanthobacter sediminis]
MTMPAPLPAIEIRPDPPPAFPFEADDKLLPNLVLWIGRAKGGLGNSFGSTVAALVAEGRRFRQTPSGRHWNAMLEDSQLAANGWMLWNLLDMDRFLTGRDLESGGDTPAQLMEEVLRQLQGAKIEELIELFNQFWRTEAGNA